MESEEIILNRIRQMKGAKTIILISHRLVNTRDADRIFVMDNGKIAESGTHRELMKWGGTYSVLWRTQQKLERLGRDEDSGEEWLTGEIEKIAATGDLASTGRIGDRQYRPSRQYRIDWRHQTCRRYRVNRRRHQACRKHRIDRQYRPDRKGGGTG